MFLLLFIEMHTFIGYGVFVLAAALGAAQRAMQFEDDLHARARGAMQSSSEMNEDEAEPLQVVQGSLEGQSVHVKNN